MKNKVGIVTGSTQGLGESITRKLISDGITGLVICGRNEINGLRLEKEFNKLGCRTVFVKTDLTNIKDCQQVIEAAKHTFHRIDILVNSAGNTDQDSVYDFTPEFFDKMFALNTKAPMYLMSEAVKFMLEKNIHGSIVNILSDCVYGGQSVLATYSASKAALAAYTKNAAFTLLRKKIRVNGINMAWTETDGENLKQKKYANAESGWQNEAGKKLPYGTLISTREIANIVSFLVSEKSGRMSGTLVDYNHTVVGLFDSYPLPKDDD